MAVSTSLRKAEQLCLLPPQVGGLWTHALPRSVRLMRTGHQLRCLVALISSLWPTGWFLLWAVTVPESWWMALMSVSGPSESSLTLAEVNREICDCKIQSIWQWKTFFFLPTERATWCVARKTRLCGFDSNPLVIHTHVYLHVYMGHSCYAMHLELCKLFINVMLFKEVYFWKFINYKFTQWQNLNRMGIMRYS